MNYDTIILEMISRIQALEETVKALTVQVGGIDTAVGEVKEMDTPVPVHSKISTADIRKHIEDIKMEAKANGKEFITLVARDINNDLKLKNRYPMVCNAMKQCMNVGDEIVYAPTSGYSSTLEIKYFL